MIHSVVVCVRVAGAVEHGRPHRVREHRRPRRTELASVAEAEVRDRVLTESAADDVDVTRRVVRADVFDDVGVVGHAVIGELLGEVDGFLSLLRGLGRDVGLGEEAVVVVDAVDGRLALAGAPRIPADDVEMVEQLLVVGHEFGEDGELAPTESRPAGVHEQGTDPLVGLGGAVAGEVELEGGALGIGVVDRDVERRNIDALGGLLPLDRSRLELIGSSWWRTAVGARFGRCSGAVGRHGRRPGAVARPLRDIGTRRARGDEPADEHGDRGDIESSPKAPEPGSAGRHGRSAYEALDAICVRSLTPCEWDRIT